MSASAESEPPQISAMRQELEKDPSDLSKLRVFAGMLGDVLRSNPAAPPALVFEAIDIFGRILQQEPNDPAALVMMADVSFDQRAFTKALDFYERYLKIDPNDLGARSRYASTLTFLGRYDESISELNAVLKTEPKNFPAMAYLAITYAQKGDIATAKKVGGDALAVAPSEDARARFSSFVSSLDAPQGEEPAPKLGDANTLQQAETVPAGIGALEGALRANPVAGPKFFALRQPSEARLELVYRDFPMAQMPPFAKEKFLGGVKAAIAQNKLSQVQEVVFVDHQTGAVMETLRP
jgi:tetratricopeptide (TPR) repeat protein